MEEVKWLEVTVNTTPDKLDEVTARLAAAGMDALVIEDEGDFLNFLEQNRQYWDYVDQELLDRMKGVTRVKFYVSDDADGRAQLERYTRGLGWEYTVTPLTDSDWAYSWQKYYKPLPVGQRLYVVPQWEREEPVPAGRVPLYLNPGLTFGTGSHASTQLCLEGVEEHTAPGLPVLDLGCGSGCFSPVFSCQGLRGCPLSALCDTIQKFPPSGGMGLNRFRRLGAVEQRVQYHTRQNNHKPGQNKRTGIFLQENSHPDRAENHLPQGNDRRLLGGHLLHAHVIQGVAASHLDHA